MGGAAEQRHPWWERGVVYQVYPRSFADEYLSLYRRILAGELAP